MDLNEFLEQCLSTFLSITVNFPTDYTCTSCRLLICIFCIVYIHSANMSWVVWRSVEHVSAFSEIRTKKFWFSFWISDQSRDAFAEHAVATKRVHFSSLHDHFFSCACLGQGFACGRARKFLPKKLQLPFNMIPSRNISISSACNSYGTAIHISRIA